jgi:hypothetical protein
VNFTIKVAAGEGRHGMDKLKSGRWVIVIV